MNKLSRILILSTLIITLVFIGYFFGLRRAVTIIVNGQPQTVITRALTVSNVIVNAGIPLTSEDHVRPERNKLVGWNTIIHLEQARPVTIFNEVTGQTVSFRSAERIPASLLVQIGINPSSDDQVLWNGMPIALTEPLPPAIAYFLQYRAAKALHLVEDGNDISLQTTAPTILRALWDNGVRLSAADRLSIPAGSLYNTDQQITLQRAVPLSIQTGQQQIIVRSAATTVGQALAESGIALQGQDYSLPAEDQPLPADGKIRLVRVREEILLEQTTVPFEREFVADPDLELDQIRLIKAGRYGIQVTRLRVRYEDGLKVSRTTESQWTASEPQPEQIGYGTKVVIRTLQTPEGTIEYWRAVPVYATSYSPCRSGSTRCYYGTASGLPVQRGVISVTSKWYRLMAGQRVYVPGYGYAVIGDVGGGIPGQYWIDLAFTDADFEPWHQNTILYFLTPVPADIPWILP